ncbi:MAG: hypothetical protein U9Q88_00175 [Bacillota bacterium]|nr:hypothetical protein [Bacillota bacterium]
MFKGLKNTIIIILTTLVISLVVIPIVFNYLFLWESGQARGDTSDWFTLYGGILSGLIGGLFTYLALMLTLRNDSKKEQEFKKVEEKRNIIQFTLKSRVYYDLLNTEMRNITEIKDDAYNYDINVKAANIDFTWKSFSDCDFYLELTSEELKKYKESLMKMEKITKDYMSILSEYVTLFKSNEEYFQKVLDVYLAIENINTSVKEKFISNSFNDLDFYLNFISSDTEVGYTFMLRNLGIEINKLWDENIRENDEYGDLLRTASYPHIKG